MNKQRFIVTYIVIITFPIIDLLTTVTQHLPVSIGALVRTFMMVLLVVLLYKQLHDDTLEKRILFVTTYFIIGLSFIIQLIMKDPFFMLAELQFYMKAAYFVTLLYTVLILRVDTWLTQRDIAEIIHIITLIIGITYWTAI